MTNLHRILILDPMHSVSELETNSPVETNLTSSFSGFQFTTSRISIIHSQVAAGSYKSPFSGIFMFFFCVYAFLFDFELVIEVNWWWWLCDADVRDGGEGDGVPGRAFQPVSDEPSSCCTTTSPPPGWGLWDQLLSGLVVGTSGQGT